MLATGRRSLVPALAALALFAAPSSADAAFKAKSSLVTKAGATRIVVKLTSTRSLTARTRPRAVKVKAGRRGYRLTRARGAGAAAVVAGTWNSKAYRGSGAANLLGLAGKRLTVLVRSRAGTSTLRSRVTGPSTGGGGGGGQQQPADPRTRFLNMFNNSGWDRPYSVNGIPYEDLYNFCADGRYYNRYTSGQTGTDYPSSGTWELRETATGTVGGYNVVEGRVILNQTSPDPKQSEIIVDLSEQVPNSAYINQNEFTRVAPQAC